VRWGNTHVKAALAPLSSHRALLRVPPLPASAVGGVMLELVRGAYLSPTVQLLVTPDAALATEING
jgi:hypothetical protein